MSDQLPSVGRIVHYVLPEGRSTGQDRPAIIVRVWGEDEVASGQLDPSALGTVQLQVFTDSGPDGYNDELPPVMWRSSVRHDEETKDRGTWHWPERVEATTPTTTLYAGSGSGVSVAVQDYPDAESARA